MRWRMNWILWLAEETQLLSSHPHGCVCTYVHAYNNESALRGINLAPNFYVSSPFPVYVSSQLQASIIAPFASIPSPVGTPAWLHDS